MLMSTGKADDAAGETEEHFLEWKQTVFQLFRTTLNYQQQQVRYEPALEVREDELIPAGELWSGIPYVPKAFSTQSKVAPLPIVSCHDLLQGSPDRMCLHIELDTTQHPNLKYKTGDHLVVWPINPTQEIQLLLSALGLERRRMTPIRIKALGSFSRPIPSPTTLEAVFQEYLEICAPVPRESIEALIAYAPTAAARTFLESVSCDKTSYAAYMRSQYLNLGRLFEAACPAPGAWTSVPLSLVIEMLPAMRPRSYSISSSSVVSPRKISITVAVSDTTSVDSPDRVIGLATNYLLNANGGSHPKALTYSKLLENGQVYAAVRKSTFKLPLSSSAPVVMVGAGTGVAPFRAFVQERARLKSVRREVGPTRLFFGCRDRSQDLIYDEDFSRWKGDMGDCFSMTTAFSRPKDGGEKQYVQDAILTDAEAVCKLLVEENAYFYICGSAAMARDVSAAATAIIMKAQGWDETKMKEFADRQKRQKRWLQDVWG
ncbi:hypothetical protein BDY17DRAFT_300534 [Neohortaea acidophila]|uniref:FAD-binding FR-type domain-containing protein n=1 Tax=Neohortaea acidophila TaxID=245834 RepID=A0A6A6PMX9_9PEZI|nr:uncharacterized protein BDY17DRAFT_300534 [Neohortaea acidophila]KAF2480994.1 hypothetical protein BDY17DRAFT_300534 [Neohortaea acidophila]